MNGSLFSKFTLGLKFNAEKPPNFKILSLEEFMFWSTTGRQLLDYMCGTIIPHALTQAEGGLSLHNVIKSPYFTPECHNFMA